MAESPQLNPHPSFSHDGDVFPRDLGVIVQRTVLDGLEPVRLVVHDADGDWLIGDGVNDPNLDDACVIVHIAHLLTIDSSLGALAGMLPGQMAERDQIDAPWAITVHRYEE